MEMTVVPYANLNRIYKKYKDEIDYRLNQCIENSQFINGPQVAEFENKLTKYLGQTSVGVSSGTAAQQLSLLACGIGPSDEVIVPSMTFFSTAETVNQVGATPIFCDINLNDYTIDTALIESLITEKTKAIMPVDLYGQQADYATIKNLCNKYNLYLIQDSAQSFGSMQNNNPVGYYSDLAIHSFYPGKNLDCMGDGGGVTGTEDLIDRVRLLKDHGRTEKYVHQVIGWNHRLDGMQAAILNAKIDHIDELNQSRRRNANYYLENLKNTPLVLPTITKNNTHVYNQFCVLYTYRDDLRSFLLSHGIDAGIQFPLGCHQQPAYSNHHYSLPVTEKVARECLSLPVFPFMTEKELDHVCSTILLYFSSK
jgi:dTDP-4-amino-4,6-dideoxygalactose transaminase